MVKSLALALTHGDRDATDILEAINALKFRLCLTLFAAVAPEEPCFKAALGGFLTRRSRSRDSQATTIYPERGLTPSINPTRYRSHQWPLGVIHALPDGRRPRRAALG